MVCTLGIMMISIMIGIMMISSRVHTCCCSPGAGGTAAGADFHEDHDEDLVVMVGRLIVRVVLQS